MGEKDNAVDSIPDVAPYQIVDRQGCSQEEQNSTQEYGLDTKLVGAE